MNKHNFLFDSIFFHIYFPIFIFMCYLPSRSITHVLSNCVCPVSIRSCNDLNYFDISKPEILCGWFTGQNWFE